MTVTRVSTAELRHPKENPRLHPVRNLRGIVHSLRRFGQQKPIVISPEGEVIAGNGTLEAAISLGWTELDAIVTALNPSEYLAYAVADNRCSDLADWDIEALQAAWKSTSSAGDEDVLHFELESLLIRKDLAPLDEVDSNPEGLKPAAAVTQPGDVWILGEHRLLCGDSGVTADVDRLLDGASIHLVHTDPPYNVKVEPRSNNAIAAGLSSFGSSDTTGAGKRRGLTQHQGFDLARGHSKAKKTTQHLRAKDRPLINDFVNDRAFEGMLDAWFGQIARVLQPGRSFYVWGGYANCANYPPALRKHALYFSQALIWVKGHAVLTRKDFMGDHEWCFYGWMEGGRHLFFGPPNVSDVWWFKKIPPQRMVHLTEKPVELAARAMELSSQKGECVLDLFGGSGSTLIAAERLGRRAFLMELDPQYCDVIVRRFERETGTRAERRPAAGSSSAVPGLPCGRTLQRPKRPPRNVTVGRTASDPTQPAPRDSRRTSRRTRNRHSVND